MLKCVVAPHSYAEFEHKMLFEFCSDPQGDNFSRYEENKNYHNYLYLDPRVLREMAKCDEPQLEERLNFHLFVESIFYIGKEKADRAIAHLQDTQKWLTDHYMDMALSFPDRDYDYDIFLETLKDGLLLYRDAVSYNYFSHVDLDLLPEIKSHNKQLLDSWN